MRLLPAALLTTLLCPAMAQAEQSLGAGDDGRTVAVRPHASLTVALPSNGTTGYRWSVTRVPVGARVISDSYAAPADGKTGPAPIVGAPGRQVFVIRVGRFGGALDLQYHQAWVRPSAGDQAWRARLRILRSAGASGVGRGEP